MGLLVLMTSCNNLIPSNSDTSNVPGPSDADPTENPNYNLGDLITLHSSSSGLVGGDLSDDGSVLVFGDEFGSGRKLFKKNLLTSTIVEIGDDLEQINKDRYASGYFFGIQAGYASFSGFDGTKFHVDHEGDYSYFTASGFDGSNTTSALYRKTGRSSTSEKVLELGSGVGLTKGSISKSGEYVLFSSTSLELLGVNDIDPNNRRLATGITNIFKYNTTTSVLDPITSKSTEADIGFYAYNQTISDNGEHILYNVMDLQNVFSQPQQSISGYRPALIYEKLGADSKKIVINDAFRYPENFKNSWSQKISANGLHAVFQLSNSSGGFSYWTEIHHFDSTQGGEEGLVRKISTNQNDEDIRGQYGNTNFCDLSPDGNLVGIISNDMNFIGQNRLSSSQLFVKNVATKSVQLISSQISGEELPGKVLTCYFTEQGRSIVFTIEENNSANRLILKKVLSTSP